MRFFLTTWTNTPVLSGAPVTTYNDATVTYSSASTNYGGQALPVWTNANQS